MNPAQSARSRRQFLADVGRGTLMAAIGPALASELGFTSAAFAADGPEALAFGDIEPLVCFMQETAIGKLQPALAAKLKSGVPLKRLLAAGALANARSFGGEDYIGFHTLMAMTPAMRMADQMPSGQAALPVFKVLYRNTNRIHDHGGRGAEVLHPVPESSADAAGSPGQLREAVHAKDKAAAERTFAAMVRQDADAAFNDLLEIVQENPEVHRTVLPYRAWDLLGLVGREHAETLLRQSLRYCIEAESRRRPEWEQNGKALTRLLDEHKLLGRESGKKPAEDSLVDKWSQSIFSSTPDQAAAVVAAALGEGFDPAAIGEALSLAANRIVLCDPGRPPAWESPGKPPGSVHGDSIGVHASDSVNAWRNLSRASRGRNVHACLILGAWQAARDRGGRAEIATASPLPAEYQSREANGITDGARLLGLLDEAIRQNLQSHAVAAAHRYAQLSLPEQPVFDLLLKYGVSEDGSLHAEKYFQTVWDDFHSTRPAFRWRHLTGLARVTASEFGRPAAGQAEARELVGVA